MGTSIGRNTTEVSYLHGDTGFFALLYLDELARLGSLLEGAAHLMRGEVKGGVAGSDVLLDRLDAGAVALLQGLDGLEHHLPWFRDETWGQGTARRISASCLATTNRKQTRNRAHVENNFTRTRAYPLVHV